MATRIAAVTALLAFVICLLAGGAADNTFTTTVGRALLAMMVTLVIGLVVGGMARKMLDENLKSQEEKLKNSSASLPRDGR